MARKYANEKELEELRNLQERTERKLKAQSRYMPDVSLERFGFNSAILDEPNRMTLEEYNDVLADLKEFNTKQYRVVNIGSSENREYIPSNKFDEAKEILREYNRFASMRQKSLKVAKQYYYGIDEQGNVVQRERETPFEQTEEGRMYRPVKLEFADREMGNVDKGLAFETMLIQDEEELDRFISRYRSRATDFGSIRIQQLEDNFFKGLANRTSDMFAKAIRNQLDELGVDAIDFLFLFDTTAVFDFKFIYDAKITIADIKEELVSEIERLKKQGAEGYDEYRDIVNKYEKEV